MNYDFDKIIDRRGTDCIKFDFARERGKPEGLLPMWVADMDFAAPPEVLEDLHAIIGHGIFGYTEPKENYFEAVASWFGARFGYRPDPRGVVPAPGVVFGLAQAILAFTRPGDPVLIQTPVYPPFFEIVRANGRRLLTNPLRRANGRYAMDFDHFERQLTRRGARLFLLCHPHNPVGRVWRPDELRTVRDLCQRHGVTVISDEIHCDFAWPGHSHASYALLDENAVIATAPSKTFNLAGLQIANFFVRSAEPRRRLQSAIARSGYSQLNTLGLAACRSAYAKGGPWLDTLKPYLLENIGAARDFLAERLPRVRMAEPEGTYLLWLDFSDYKLPQAELDRRVTHGAGLWLSGGTSFGEDGEGFQRMNIACPRATLEEGLRRLEREFGEVRG